MERDEPLTLTEAASYLKVSPRTVSNLIKSGELIGKRTSGGTGKYLVLLSACIDYLTQPTQNHPASMGDGKKGVPSCQSPSEAGYGTVISLRQMAKGLEDRLAHRTRNKRRSYTTS
ncbi:helix-turn-helix domain-containing protein [Sodalis sp.]|uniref:helix-turn-helix domain-containing protein n=1 Tax=Sodalis sp. (in: enterobacteria) TaxID=1898979 RepID=UPI0038737D2E